MMNMTFVHQGDDPWNRQATRQMTPDAPGEATGSKGSDIRQDEKLLLNKSKLRGWTLGGTLTYTKPAYFLSLM